MQPATTSLLQFGLATAGASTLSFGRKNITMQSGSSSALSPFAALCLISTCSFGQVGPLSTSWRDGDAISNQTDLLLANGRIAMNEARFISAENLAKRCATGLRVTSKGAFGEPESIVMLFGLKSNARLEGIPSVGWREYWFADTSALTINRVTKILELKDKDNLARVIATTSLWKLKNQEDIEGFNIGVTDGYSVEVELISEGRSKRLDYSNPDAYNQEENLQFRAALHKLLADLGLSSDGFVYGLSELKKFQPPAATKEPNKAEQGGTDQPATAPQSKPEGNQNPKSESEERSQ